ncbi:hypothetical protein DL991_16080 [Amycolatopsis sp. WAC 01375]|uniref:hypothetical protein n=1 Tax=unclassified Amycolatopsis TaxID=2618356 RepID=UPI000F791338|nr:MULTISPECIES: hypothetical protein [unclassified Amycolatopsis]RSM78828.1 hypothetical protein DL991_16080 [Amycolatopsis sp. WAC 01375]RSN32279.1 hypothetical protein DL990_20450 [Amycolatopsis sp. WAC 01416]
MQLGDGALLSGERLLWEGAPRRVPLVETSDLTGVPGLLFIGFLLYPATRGPVSRIVYVVPSVILLLWIGKGIKRYLETRTSSFVVTDRRVVVRRRGGEVTSRYLSDLGAPRLVEHPGGTGTITFDDGLSTGFLGGRTNRDAGTAAPRLVRIADGYHVRDLIVTAHQVRPAG